METLDVFPTLCELAGLSMPDFAQGQSLAKALDGDEIEGSGAYSYAGKGRTVRTDQFRMIEHKDGFIELYDMTRDGSPTQNIAEENPEVVRALKARIAERFSPK